MIEQLKGLQVLKCAMDEIEIQVFDSNYVQASDSPEMNSLIETGIFGKIYNGNYRYNQYIIAYSISIKDVESFFSELNQLFIDNFELISRYVSIRKVIQDGLIRYYIDTSELTLENHYNQVEIDTFIGIDKYLAFKEEYDLIKRTTQLGYSDGGISYR